MIKKSKTNSKTIEENENIIALVSHACQKKGLSKLTEKNYIAWIKQYQGFLEDTKLEKTGEVDVYRFLRHLSYDRGLLRSSLHIAKCAIKILYQDVLSISLPNIDLRNCCDTGKTGKRNSQESSLALLSKKEVTKLLNAFDDQHAQHALLVGLYYGSGLRLLEALELRIGDVNFESRKIQIRNSRGENDRQVPLPTQLVDPLMAQIAYAKRLHLMDVAEGFGEAWLPHYRLNGASKRTKEWQWQYIFPSPNTFYGEEFGAKCRNRINERNVTRAIKAAGIRAGIKKNCTPRFLRMAFIAHLLESGCSTEFVRRMAGHVLFETTSRYVNRRRSLQMDSLVKSPLDML